MLYRIDVVSSQTFNFIPVESESGDKSWNYVKVVCSQPYNKNWPFGIVFVALRGSAETEEVEVSHLI